MVLNRIAGILGLRQEESEDPPGEDPPGEDPPGGDENAGEATPRRVDRAARVIARNLGQRHEPERAAPYHEYGDGRVVVRLHIRRIPMVTVEIVRDGQAEPVYENMPGNPDSPVRYNPGAWTNHLMSMEPRARRNKDAGNLGAGRKRDIKETRDRETAAVSNIRHAEMHAPANDSGLFPETPDAGGNRE